VTNKEAKNRRNCTEDCNKYTLFCAYILIDLLQRIPYLRKLTVLALTFSVRNLVIKF
jgi:hypothetical protein